MVTWPVCHLKRTYERTAIEDCFTTHKTDPMTGETLFTTALYPDLVMRMVCDRQRAAPKQSSRRGKSVDCKPTVGGAGRGGRGGPTQPAKVAEVAARAVVAPAAVAGA